MMVTTNSKYVTMVDRPGKRRKFLLFALLTLFLIFFGMFIQHKTKVLEVPIASKIMTKIDEFTRQRQPKTDNENQDDDGGEINEKKNDKDNSARASWGEKNLNRISDGKSAADLLRKYGLDDDIKIIKGVPELEAPTTQKTTKPLKKMAVNNNSSIVKVGEHKKRYPTAIIAGVKKGGTRALLSFLGKHPLVMSGGKEMHFFDKDENYQNGLSYYLNEMPLSYENELTIEKTPGYFVQPYVPQRIFDLNKKMKLIFILRDPVQRAISDYAQALTKDESKSLERIIFTKKKPKRINPRSSKVSIGMYSEHLKNWLKLFPLNQMYFVNGDEFIQNPVPEIIAVQKFLNLPVLINEKSFFFNETKGFYCIIKQEGDGPLIKNCLGSTKGRKHPEIKDNTLERLTEFYKPYNRKLFRIINKDFGWPTDSPT